MENKIEIWKDIKGFEGLYQVSNLGRVKNNISGNILKPIITHNGYLRLGLYNKKRIFYFVHRLVAETFIPNPNNYPCVNHKDEDKTNNCVWNLEWCTHKYNSNYGTVKIRLSEMRKGENNPFYSKHNSEYQKQRTRESLHKTVAKYTKDNKYICTYYSVKEAAILNNIATSNISNVCNNKPNNKTAGGFIWKWAN